MPYKVGILILVFSLSQNYLTRGFWGDEAWTSMISQLPYLDMLKTTASDFHPPAFYTMIELVYKFFAPTEIVTRSISIIFYLLTLFLVYKLASEIKDRLFGIVSALVVAVNPIFFTYAFEARNYTMFAFSATGSVYFLIKLCQKFSTLRVAGFVLFSTLGIYTHYYMFFILFAQALYILIFERKLLVRMIGIYAIVGVLYLPWIPFLFGQLTSVSESYWIGGIDKRTHFEALLRILGGEQQNGIRPILFWLSSVLLVFGFFFGLIKGKLQKHYFLIFLWAVVPFVLASLPGLKIGDIRLPFRPIFFWRYLLGSAIPFGLLIVASAQQLKRYYFTAVVGAILLLSVALDFVIFSGQPYSFREVYREKVIPEINNDDKIVTVLPSFAEVLYYRNRNHLQNELIVLPLGLVQFSGKSLLDAYVASGKVKISEEPEGKSFRMLPGPTLEIGGD